MFDLNNTTLLPGILSFLDNIQDIIATFVTHQIFLAPILLLILEEAGFPLPVSDFVIAYTGYQVSLGHIPYFSAFAILVVSDLLGASILYFLCRRYGAKLVYRIDKFLPLDTDKLAVVEEKFRKFGPLVIIFGRHIPGFRVPITIFSGISKMGYVTFIGSTLISIIFWIPFYLSIGARLGPRTVHLFHASHWSYFLILLPIIWAFLPFIFLRKRKNKVKKEPHR